MFCGPETVIVARGEADCYIVYKCKRMNNSPVIGVT